MEESVLQSTFYKLRYDKYLTLDVLLYIDYFDASEFLFSLNKDTRNFANENAFTIRNGYNNEGLIKYESRCEFFHI